MLKRQSIEWIETKDLANDNRITMMLFNNIAFSLHFCSFFIKIISKSSLTTNRYGDLFFNDYPNKKAIRDGKGQIKILMKTLGTSKNHSGYIDLTHSSMLN